MPYEFSGIDAHVRGKLYATDDARGVAVQPGVGTLARLKPRPTHLRNALYWTAEVKAAAESGRMTADNWAAMSRATET